MIAQVNIRFRAIKLGRLVSCTILFSLLLTNGPFPVLAVQDPPVGSMAPSSAPDDLSQSLSFPGSAIKINWPGGLSTDPVIAAIIKQVETQRLYNYVGSLSGEWPVTIGGVEHLLTSRNSLNEEAISLATQYAYEHFQSLGLNTGYYTFNLSADYGERRNVIAEQPGSSQPERIFLLTAHIDNMPGVGLAPGADDNASGSAAVMLAAEILSNYEFDSTLRYILFSGEEQGLIGSEAYAQHAAALGENIEAILNLDMIGYNTRYSERVMELHTRFNNASDLKIASMFQDVDAAYGLSIEPEIIQDGITASDHYSFWEAGFPGILAIEDMQDFTDAYHTEEDTLSTLDLYYFTDIARGAIGTFAHLGGLAPPTASISGQVTDENSGMPVGGAKIQATREGGAVFSTTTGSDGSYQVDVYPGIYTITISAQSYFSSSVLDIHATEGTTTMQDFSLRPSIPVYLPLITKSKGNVTIESV